MEVDEEGGCLPFEKAFSSSDTDEVLPPLESATVKKLNATNAAEQKRFEKLERQLKREKHEARVRLFLQRKGFVRSSLVLREWRRLNSRGNGEQSSLADAPRRGKDPARSSEKNCANEAMSSGNIELSHGSVLRRPPVRLQPIHTQINTDLKTLQSQRTEIDKLRKTVDIESIPKCRYLRVNFEDDSTV